MREGGKKIPVEEKRRRREVEITACKCLQKNLRLREGWYSSTISVFLKGNFNSFEKKGRAGGGGGGGGGFRLKPHIEVRFK